jgi:F420-dependent oxidoreductase-like protein
MKFSIFLPSGFTHEFADIPEPRAAYERLVQIARAADDSGYEALLMPDHLTAMQPAQQTQFEAWSTLTGLAGHTTRVKLGLLVASVGYRNPALAAKIASTVDVISNGRLVFGLGAGWHEPDYVQYGFDFGSAKERLQRLEEAVQIVLGLWTQDETTFDGRFYRVDGAINQPKGIQQPHIPLMIAGSGEKVTLRTVARYADASNIADSPEVLRHKYDVLKRHAEDAGRDYDTIKRTVMVLVHIADTDAEAHATLPAAPLPIYPGDVASYGLIGSTTTVAERIAAFEEAGAQELALHFANLPTAEQITHFAQTFTS